MLLGWGLVLAGCGFAPLPEAEPVDAEVEGLGIEVDGQIVEVASGDADGESWSVVALRATDGDVCLVEVVAGMSSGANCGDPMLPDQPFAGMSQSFVGQGQRPLIYARLSGDAGGARVVTDVGAIDARVASLGRLHLDERAMALLLPAGARPSAVEVLGSGGAVLQRVELGPMP